MKKLKLQPYRAEFPAMFEKQRKRIAGAVKDFEIHHIGSTAVPGLGGKGIVDIMIAINNWSQADRIIEKLKSLDFTHIHPREQGRIFVSNKKEGSIADVHLHIVKKGGKVYKDLLFFRDYLRGRPKQVNKLFKQKLKWQTQSKGDWKLYNELKSKYVNKILNKT